METQIEKVSETEFDLVTPREPNRERMTLDQLLEKRQQRVDYIDSITNDVEKEIETIDEMIKTVRDLEIKTTDEVIAATPTDIQTISSVDELEKTINE